MDESIFHRAVILEEVFEGSSSIYPLSIIHTGEENSEKPVYIGVHFVSTSCLLSLIQPKAARITAYFDKKGNRLNSPLANEIAFTFTSVELGLWCEQLMANEITPVMFCDQPYIYRDTQFESFERIAMEFPAYATLLDKSVPLGHPSDELIKKLDAELLRLRSMLL